MAESDPGEEKEEPAEGEPESEPETKEAAAWEPVHSYKVRDEEHEFDEWARPFIKDEETYKNFQDLYTRGHGPSAC